MSQLAKAALWYAAYGWRVLPCIPGDKLPGIKGWQRQATTDARQVETWWRARPQSNVAIATGPDSGVFVIDVDCHHADGEATLMELLDRFGPLPPTVTQRTGSGGRQLFFAWPAGEDLRNSAGVRHKVSGKVSGIGLGVDTRGAGGFVVVPPSLHPCGDLYRWLDGRRPTDLAPAPLPEPWLVRLRKPPDPPRIAVPIRPLRRDGDLAQRAIDDHIQTVASAPKGQRNDTLYKSAFRLAVLGHRRLVPLDEAMQAMRAAGEATGLPRLEVERTIRSAREGARAVA